MIAEFLARIQAIAATGEATEHSYRSALESLLNASDDNIRALNEPKRVACGAPDFIIQRGDIAIGHLEAKDLAVPQILDPATGTGTFLAEVIKK